MKAVALAWKRIEDELGAGARKLLRPPATPRALAALEHTLGRRLPRELAASLAIHDGTATGQLLWSNEQLLGALAAARRMKSMKERGAGAWIPLTDADGDGFCLDARSGKVIRFQNYASGPPRIAAQSFVAWLQSIPRQLAAEARAEGATAALLEAPRAKLTKRERERLARMDEELPFLVAFVEDLRARRQPSTRPRVLVFRPIGRFSPEQILGHALDRAFLSERGPTISVTAAGRRLRKAAFG